MESIENTEETVNFDNNDLDIFDQKTVVHIHLERYKGFKTVIKNLEKVITLDEIKSMLKDLRKILSCAASYGKKHKRQKKDDLERVIKLQGDHRDEIKKYLIDKNIVEEDSIEIHGY